MPFPQLHIVQRTTCPKNLVSSLRLEDCHYIVSVGYLSSIQFPRMSLWDIVPTPCKNAIQFISDPSAGSHSYSQSQTNIMPVPFNSIQVQTSLRQDPTADLNPWTSVKPPAILILRRATIERHIEAIRQMAPKHTIEIPDILTVFKIRDA